MKVLASTQHPGEEQFQVAGALGLQGKDVVVECRRMGGGFGGKEPEVIAVAMAAQLLGLRPLTVASTADGETT